MTGGLLLRARELEIADCVPGNVMFRRKAHFSALKHVWFFQFGSDTLEADGAREQYPNGPFCEAPPELRPK